MNAESRGSKARPSLSTRVKKLPSASDPVVVRASTRKTEHQRAEFEPRQSPRREIIDDHRSLRHVTRSNDCSKSKDNEEPGSSVSQKNLKRLDKKPSVPLSGRLSSTKKLAMAKAVNDPELCQRIQAVGFSRPVSPSVLSPKLKLPKIKKANLSFENEEDVRIPLEMFPSTQCSAMVQWDWSCNSSPPTVANSKTFKDHSPVSLSSSQREQLNQLLLLDEHQSQDLMPPPEAPKPARKSCFFPLLELQLARLSSNSEVETEELLEKSDESIILNKSDDDITNKNTDPVKSSTEFASSRESSPISHSTAGRSRNKNITATESSPVVTHGRPGDHKKHVINESPSQEVTPDRVIKVTPDRKNTPTIEISPIYQKTPRQSLPPQLVHRKSNEKLEAMSPLTAAFYQNDSLNDSLIACTDKVEEEVKLSQMSSSTPNNSRRKSDQQSSKNGFIFVNSFIESSSQVAAVAKPKVTPTRKSPRQAKSNRTSSSPPRKVPLVVIKPDLDFNPSWMESIKMATSPMNASIKAESQSPKSRKSQDNKTISRTLFSSSKMVTRSTSDAEVKKKLNKSYDPFEDSLDMALDDIDRIEAQAMTQIQLSQTCVDTTSLEITHSKPVPPLQQQTTQKINDIKPIDKNLNLRSNTANQTKHTSQSLGNHVANSLKINENSTLGKNHFSNLSSQFVQSNISPLEIQISTTKIYPPKNNMSSVNGIKNFTANRAVNMNTGRLINIPNSKPNFAVAFNKSTQSQCNGVSSTNTGHRSVSRSNFSANKNSQLASASTAINSVKQTKSSNGAALAQAESRLASNIGSQVTPVINSGISKQIVPSQSNFKTAISNNKNPVNDHGAQRIAFSNNVAKSDLNSNKVVTTQHTSQIKTGGLSSINSLRSKPVLNNPNGVKIVPKIANHQTLINSTLTRHRSADFNAPPPALQTQVVRQRKAASPLVRHKTVGDFRHQPNNSLQKYSAAEIERKRQEAKQRLLSRKHQQFK